MSVDRCLAALGLLAAFAEGGCASHQDTCGSLPDLKTKAIFDLTCDAANLVSVGLSGPCATGDTSPSNYRSSQGVEVGSPSPGVCHVVLTFATGFTYSTDVTFASQTADGCDGPQSYVGPTTVVFSVADPAAACADAGVDASGE